MNNNHNAPEKYIIEKNETVSKFDALIYPDAPRKKIGVIDHSDKTVSKFDVAEAQNPIE